MTFAQLSGRYPTSWEVQRMRATPNPETAWGQVIAQARGLTLLPHGTASYLSAPFQLWEEDDLVIRLLRGTPPRLEMEHAHFVDAAFLPGMLPWCHSDIRAQLRA